MWQVFFCILTYKQIIRETGNRKMTFLEHLVVSGKMK
jgi:hypothetical protein